MTSNIGLNFYHVEDLKCCGNCAHRVSLDMGNYRSEECREYKFFSVGSHRKCERWQYDGLNYNDRIIKAKDEK